MAVQVDVTEQDFESGYVAAQFDVAAVELFRHDFEVISLPFNVQLRAKYGKDAHITRTGNFTRHALVHMRGANPLFLRESPYLEYLTLATYSIEAVRHGRNFRFDRDFYEQNLEIARADSDLEPGRMRAIILPSRERFAISRSHNGKIFEGMLGKHGQEYLETVGRKDLCVYPQRPDIVDEFDGALVTQIGIGRNDDVFQSGIIGYWTLNFDYWLRGVRDMDEGSEY